MFKRSQVEDAIAAVLDRGSRRLGSEMRTRIKHLLDADRARGRKKRSSDPEEAHYAFYSADMPGKGYEIIFSEFEAFALLTGLRLLGLRWPQGSVVGLLRRLRPQLEQLHQRILRQDPAVLFDDQQISALAKPGDPAFGNTNPVFIVIVSEQDRRGSQSVELCRGWREVCELFHRFGPGYAFTLLDLVNSVHALSSALSETRPRTRGRARA